MPNTPFKIKFIFKNSKDKNKSGDNNARVSDTPKRTNQNGRKRLFSEEIDEFSSEDDYSPAPSSPLSPSPSPCSFSPPKVSEELRQRDRNIKERESFLKSFLNDPEFAEAVQSIGLLSDKPTSRPASKTKQPRRRRASSDSAFRSHCQIPVEKRKSLRLQSKEPQFSHSDLPDESSKRYYESDEDVTNLEEIVYKPTKRRRITARPTERRDILRVEDVTDAMIENIAKKVADKVYSAEKGTSCHQCRQKTTDTKTFCRSQDCIGLRGQFCGVCLLNRYGEDAAAALKDPDWECPVCRGVCNCSFCRARDGKRPTGILVPLAHKAGHKSVKDFLDSLNGTGDYADPTKNPNNLLGFSEDLQFAHMGNGVKVYVGQGLHSLDEEKSLISENEINEVSSPVPENLLGFTEDLNYAVIEGGVEVYIGSHSLS
ncbi:unnamed protein product [Phyllotreta striolata]|uniref:Zinc-finger domain-containing protein n=1 Tax=Phyllotreta striolata TaxID=444603 RepID=A0A9N9TMT7_PHYSR|nr:unnamed protein product [Phyllotreta striolata]